MVDEYQDTNALQAQIIRLLAATHNNVAVVGDDAQSIYSFRGANFRNIMDFPEAFPGTRIIKLEENYRSTQPILNLTNKIIQLAKERYDKRLFTHKQEGETPVLVQAESEQMQSRFVCQKILELREEGVPLWDIAVLFRSSFHSFDWNWSWRGTIFRLSSAAVSSSWKLLISRISWPICASSPIHRIRFRGTGFCCSWRESGRK